MKTRTHYQAALAGRPGRWTADDTEAARRVADELHYPDNHRTCTPHQLWLARQPITVDERTAFGRSFRHHRDLTCDQEQQPTFEDLGLAAQAHTDRIAIRRALVEHGFLFFTRRSITPPLHSHKSPNTS